MQRDLCKILGLGLPLLLLGSQSLAQTQANYREDRKLFNQIYNDLRQQRTRSYLSMHHRLKQYPLYPYLRYEYLNRSLSQVKVKSVQAFIKAYPDCPLTEKLRSNWLKAQARKRNWNDYLKIYRYSSDVELQCHFIHAHLKTFSDQSVLKYVAPIWLTGSSQPKACDPVFDHWEQAGMKTQSMIWQRIKLSIEANNLRLAHYLAKSLSPREKQLVDLWTKVHRQPKLVKQTHLFSSKHPSILEIVSHGLIKIANQDPQLAIKSWQRLSRRHRFTERHWGRVVRAIGIKLARNNHPKAATWLDKIPSAFLDESVFNAKLRLALRQNDWQTICNLHYQLPPKLAIKEKWQYWQARGLEMIGNRDKSQMVLHQLADVRSYYGFLASLRTLKPYALKNQKIKPSSRDFASVRQSPNIIRAYELQKLKRTHLGAMEWHFALKEMSEKQRQAAAHLAMQWRLPNWSIVALANANNKNNLSLRFPKSYSETILTEAKRNQLDPALIFAITRQESAFIPTAKSSAGALGLMQLKPRTARMIANRIKEPLRHNYELLKADRNIKLGSKYFRMMLDKHSNNTVLAAAAYNAGPTRISKWQPKYDMPADMWIETIPYRETRNYLENILAYTVIYQQLLGRQPTLNKLMPMVAGEKRFKSKP